MTSTKTKFDSITDVIPHRSPFLLVDTIIENTAGETTLAEYVINPQNPVFAGHFPQQPIFPGVFIIEHMAQVVCYCLGTWIGKPNVDYLLVRVDKAVFKAMILPEETLRTRVTITRRFDEMAIFTCKSYRDQQLVAESQLLVSFKTAKDS